MLTKINPDDAQKEVPLGNPNQVEFTPVDSLAGFWNANKFYQFIVGPLGCVSADTLIVTEQGLQRIDALTRPTRVLSWDASKGQYRFVRTSASFLKGRDVLYRVQTQHGEVHVTGHHRVLVEGRGYLHVAELQAGDAVKTCSPCSGMHKKFWEYLSPVNNQKNCKWLLSYSGIAILRGAARALIRRFTGAFTGDACAKQPAKEYRFLEACNGSGNYIETITAIERVGVDWIWDITVEGTENYITANGMVHHNSSKTTNCIFKMLAYAQLQPLGADGLRRSRWVIARPTLQQIKTTVLKDIEQWLSPIANIKVSESKVEIRTDEVHSDWHMIPLESLEDQRRLLSMQLTGCYFNEFREIPFELVAAAAGRVGRYPSKQHGGCNWYGIIADSNPPSMDSPYYKFLVENPPDNLHFTQQPSGLSENADWRKYLVDDYYENLMAGHGDDWVDVHVRSQWGEVKGGQAVYKHAFSRDFHVAKSELTPTPNQPLIIGMDFARWPAAVISQLDHMGRLLIFKELEMENTGVENFVQTKLVPVLAEQRFRGLPGYVVGDPSGVVRSQIGEESVFGMLNKRMQIPSYPAMTNNISPRLRAVEKFLLQQRGGQPALLVDPVNCPMLIKGFIYEYRYKVRKDGVMQDEPDKSNRPFPDLHDALQYAALGTSHTIQARVFRQFSTNSQGPKKVPKEAWT